MKHFFVLFLVACLPFTLLAQDKFTISGYIYEASSGESLIGATIAVPSLKKGTYSNEYGFYSLTLPANADSLELVFSFSGYERQKRSILLNKDLSIDINLDFKVLEEVVIEAEGFEEQLSSTQMSVERLSMRDAKKIPAFLGEVDIIKTLQLKPGVSSGSEGSSGIFVRGGGPDQNLVLLDNTVLYNPSHLFGFFSTFNSDAVKDVKLYKGGFPAQYGGRLSSVIDVKMNEGNNKKFSGSGGLGLIASRLTLEGPIVKDKGSFMVSGRRTYVDLITRQINRALEDDPDFNPIPDYFFYDLNAKANYQLNENNQLFLSGYFGRDQFTFNDGNFDFRFFWGNSNATLRWNHLFSPRLFMNIAVGASDYRYKITNQFDIFAFELGSDITDQTVSTDFTWIPNNKHTVKFGAKAIYHTFTVGRLNAGAEDSTFSFTAGNTFYATEFGAYIADDIEFNDKLKLNVGVRLSGFNSDGITYVNPEPRAALRWTVGKNVSLKASYARMAQYLHLVANSGATLPTDVWYPSNQDVKPQVSDQVAMGVTLTLGEDYLLSNEVYYKWLRNSIDFRNGADLFVNDNLDTEFVFGEGYAYGNEFYLEKKNGRLTGWIGYTLSWSWREFDGVDENGEFNPDNAINDGERFNPVNDKRHDISVVGIYELSRRWSFSSSWEYRSGTPTTLPIGRFPLFGPDLEIPQITPIFQKRNSFRLPAYHKLDVGVIYKLFPKWGEADLTISAYNAYNRRNPYFVFFETQENEAGIPIDQVAKQVALFPVIPSITYNFRF